VQKWRVSLFKTPQIVLFSKDLSRAAEFYKRMGFEEVFRTPSEGSPIHVDLVLDGYRIGLASEASTRHDHGLVRGYGRPAGCGHRLDRGHSHRLLHPAGPWRKAGEGARTLARSPPHSVG
jgi:catechol 2,3-dioxygenase-like lactoylglutathione lyase family enzyme